MARILLLIILFWLLYRVLKRVAASISPPQAKPDEKIVQCAQCGLRMLESETHVSNGQTLCNSPQCNSGAQK